MANSEHILVIDDSEVVLERTKAMLVAAGYEVTTTTQTVGAARYLKKCDLVIVDYYMPGFNGQAVIASLKSALGAGERAPLFYLYTTDEVVGASYKALGFDGCLVRKGELPALLPQVQAALRLRRLLNRSRPQPPPR